MRVKVNKKKHKRPDDLTPIIEPPRSAWAQLKRYPTAEDASKALREIPDDMSEALQLEPAMFLTSAARVHGLMAHWTTRMAIAKGALNAAQAAKDIGFSMLMVDRRAKLNARYKVVTEGMVKEKAKATETYAELCLAETKAETEYLRIKGLVGAIELKGKAIQAISFALRPEMGEAERAFSMHDMNQEGTFSEAVTSDLNHIKDKVARYTKKAK